ncbi:hypothetical protein BGZ82_011010, partial [Podila clonocystis]
DSNSWNDPNPANHAFRLYFICENLMHNSVHEEIPQHMHLSNHPGYSLKRPQEFFQIYGDYLLRILQMVEYGYSTKQYEIPPLDSFKILWGCDAVVTGNQLSEETITFLVVQMIAYLQELSLPKWIKNPRLSRDQSGEIKTYLDVQDGENAEGNLHRHIETGQYVFWMCQTHAQQRAKQETLEELNEFAQSRNGYVDMQQAALRVELDSTAEADQFISHLTGAGHTFNISMKLKWATSRPSVEKLCRDIAGTSVVELTIDGVTLDILPQDRDHAQCTHNLFGALVQWKTTLKFITLLNYPRPHEQCLYVKQYSLQLSSSSTRSFDNWVELERNMTKFWSLILNERVAVDYDTAARNLKGILGGNELPPIAVFTMHARSWNCSFDLNESAIVEVYSKDMLGRKDVFSSGSLWRLTVHLDDLQKDKDLFYAVQANPLLPRTQHSEGRIIARVSRQIGTPISGIKATFNGHPTDIDYSFCQQESFLTQEIEFLQWDCDHVFSQLSDYSASFLNVATEQHPSVLRLFTLDISLLSRHGLASVEKILSRSNLDHLEVVCTSVDPSMFDSIAQVLGCVQWPTLKSLKLSGDDIDMWVYIWMSLYSNPFKPSVKSEIGPQLLSLHIQGSGSACQLLSHTSALFVHGLIYSSPSVSVILKNVDFEEYFFLE